MTKERELLELALEGLIELDLDLRSEFYTGGEWNEPKVIEEIRAYLVEPTQDEKPVAEKPIAYWDTQEGKLIPAVPLSSERTCFKVPLVPLYLHPPRPFIRLTDEEILEIVGPYPDAVGGFTRKLFDTIQDKLEEKNNGH